MGVVAMDNTVPFPGVVSSANGNHIIVRELRIVDARALAVEKRRGKAPILRAIK